MTEKQFATLPVRRIFFSLALPNIFSMVSSSIYMMSDGIFVGRYIGEHALAAVNLVMPVMMILFALSDMIAIGSSVKVSTAMGEGKIEKAKNLFSASVGMIIGLGVTFCILGMLFAKPLLFMMFKDDVLAQMAYDYLRVFLMGFPFVMPLFAMDNFLRACGKAKYVMWLNISMSLLNIVLDWLFIAKFGWGIEASALSSVLSMLLGSFFSFAPFFTKKITLHFAKPKISLSEITGIVYNGASEFFSNIAGSFIATVVNFFLLNLGGAIAVASYSIVMYIDTLLIGILYGVLDSVQPAVSYNMGAKQIKRTFSFFKITSLATVALSLVCMTMILLFPQALASIFTQAGNMEIIEMTTGALMLFAPSYLFTWFTMVASAFLTAMDKPKESMIIMLFRAIIFPLISLFALTSVMGVYGVFFMSTVSGAATFVVALVIWTKAEKKLKQCMAS
ncbi:MAG: MATE family efflux transporter [Ruthenibacterium sp.]